MAFKVGSIYATAELKTDDWMKGINTLNQTIINTQNNITRRKFISNMSNCTAGLAVGPYITAPKKNNQKKSGKIVKIGIVGGRFGTSFYWHEHPDCKVTAVCDLRKDRQKKLMETA